MCTFFITQVTVKKDFFQDSTKDLIAEFFDRHLKGE